MSLQTRIESLVLRLAAEFKTLYGQTGTLANLTTLDKTNLVAAINELRENISTVQLEASGLINDLDSASVITTFSASKITGNRRAEVTQ